MNTYIYFPAMAVSVKIIASDAPRIIKKFTKHSETECQKCQSCVKLKLQLKTAIEIIEIWKEKLGLADALYDANTSTRRNSENESQISPSECSWIQIQSYPHKKVTDKSKDQRETYR
jgi:hypothetical protein